jgi:uncharacterized protein YbjT (DUF2867 family)
MNIMVVGGPGLMGSKVVTVLRKQGHRATPASPDSGVNTLTGEGLLGALEGAATVVDVTNAPPFDGSAAQHFFETSTRNLLAAEATAHVRHHVLLSVVGTERLVESGYFRGKKAQEALVERGPIQYTLVRATQFFEFIDLIADAATDEETVRLPPVFIQPAAADDVASVVGEVATGPPKNGMIQVAGPQRFRLDELVRRLLDDRHDSRRVTTDADARYFGARLSEQTLVPVDDAITTGTRFTEWHRRARLHTR